MQQTTLARRHRGPDLALEAEWFPVAGREPAVGVGLLHSPPRIRRDTADRTERFAGVLAHERIHVAEFGVGESGVGLRER